MGRFALIVIIRIIVFIFIIIAGFVAVIVIIVFVVIVAMQMSVTRLLLFYILREIRQTKVGASRFCPARAECYKNREVSLIPPTGQNCFVVLIRVRYLSVFRTKDVSLTTATKR